MRLYLSAMENREIQDIYSCMKDRNGFFSYYYMRTSIPNSIKAFKKAKKHNMHIIIDSGAHTFFSEKGVDRAGVVKKNTQTKETYRQYIDNYYKWLMACKDYIDYFVELDIGEIVGQKKVDEWYNELKVKGLDSKCIRVYHPKCCPKGWWEEQIKTNTSKYVGIEGKRFGKVTIDYKKLIKQAYDKGVKVHGFAMTGIKDITTYPFYSVDSTSWQAGVRFGTLPVFDKKSCSIKQKRYSDINKWDKSMNLADYYNDNKKVGRMALSKQGIKSFHELEDYVTNLWIKRNIVWE